MMPFSLPSLARLKAALTSSFVTSRPSVATKSTTDTVEVGTRNDIPVNFPLSSGMTSVTAFGAPVARLLRRGVERALRVGVRVHRGEEALLDPELVVEHLRDGREPVGRARSVRDDVVLLGIELVLVDAEDDCLVLVLRRRRDDHVLRTRVD